GRLRSTEVEIFDYGRTPVEIFDRWLRPQSNIFDYGRTPQSTIFDWSRNFPATGRKTIGTTERGGRTPVEIFDRWLRPQSNCSTTVEWWFDPSRILSTAVEYCRLESKFFGHWLKNDQNNRERDFVIISLTNRSDEFHGGSIVSFRLSPFFPLPHKSEESLSVELSSLPPPLQRSGLVDIMGLSFDCVFGPRLICLVFGIVFGPPGLLVRSGLVEIMGLSLIGCLGLGSVFGIAFGPPELLGLGSCLMQALECWYKSALFICAVVQSFVHFFGIEKKDDHFKRIGYCIVIGTMMVIMEFVLLYGYAVS
ncbi:hypothetical protein TorRG33x02_037720, partial [Trema orientale]